MNAPDGYAFLFDESIITNNLGSYLSFLDGGKDASETLGYTDKYGKKGKPVYTGKYKSSTETLTLHFHADISENPTISVNVHLEPIEYTISYDLDGGVLTENAPEKIIYTGVSDEFKLPTPTKEHYHFLGWSVDGGEHEKKVTIPTGTHENRTYKAVWEINSHTLTYKVDVRFTARLKL